MIQITRKIEENGEIIENIILISPGNKKFLLGVDDAGALTTEEME